MVCLLEQLERAGCKVDVDSFLPSIAKSFPFRPHDATSNQALIGLCLYDPANADVVKQVVREMPDASAHDILTVLNVKFAKVQLENIDGRVLCQSSPKFGYDKDKTIAHARAYAKAFEAEGISKDRFAIKLPSTTAGMQAGAALKAEGIESLGTMIFGVPQAIAASQANLYAISPYFNSIRAFAEEKYWINSADPSYDHPMAHRMRHIRETYDRLAKETGKPQPQVKGAGHVTAREVMAQLDLGCDHVTVLAPALEDLLAYDRLPPHQPGEWDTRWKARTDQSALNWDEWNVPKLDHSERLARLSKADPFGKQAEGDFVMAPTDVDYLADGVLDGYIEKDETSKVRMAEAIETFSVAEDKLLAFVDEMRAKVKAEA